MLELFAGVLTLGALMYHTFGMSVVDVAYVGVVGAISIGIILRSRAGVVLAVIAGATFVLGAVAVWRVDTPVDAHIYGNRAFDARVVSVDRRLDKTNLIVLDKVYNAKLQASVSGRTLVLPGDTVTVRGSVTLPQDFVTDSGRMFGYEAYLKSKGIVGIVQQSIIGPVTASQMSLARIPTIIRYWVADTFASYIAFPFDGVVAGMTVGYQGGLPEYIADLFRDTGVLHVLVLSGYNITLLAGFLAVLLRGLSFKLRSAITVVAILMLVLVSGAGVASVRAGVMGSIAVAAGLWVRSYQPMRALVVAYICFFFLSPTMIFVDPGFHLSFLATMFMILILPKIEHMFHWIPRTRHVDLRELLMLALTAPVFMLPYLMYFSGTFPVASPLANILFALVTPLIMSAGIVLVVCSIIPPLAGLVGSIVSFGGTAVLRLLGLCARLPIWETPPVPWWGVVGVYGALVCVLFKREIAAYVLHQYRRLRRVPS